MTKENPNPNAENEIIVGFHFIRKSANSLVDDLKYFRNSTNHFSSEQVINILGQIEEIEQNILSFREVLSRKI